MCIHGCCHFTLKRFQRYFLLPERDEEGLRPLSQEFSLLPGGPSVSFSCLVFSSRGEITLDGQVRNMTRGTELVAGDREAVPAGATRLSAIRA